MTTAQQTDLLEITKQLREPPSKVVRLEALHEEIEAKLLAAGRLGLLVMLALICLGPAPTLAQEAHDEHGEEQPEHAAEGRHGGEHHKNSIAVFLGSTQAEREDGERDDPQFTLGFDYERRLTNVVGIGAIADFVLEGHREGILAAAVAFHAGEAKFVLAPGVERVRETGDFEGIVRFGLMYAFPAGRVHLEPSVFYDVTKEGGTWVAGLTIGHEW